MANRKMTAEKLRAHVQETFNNIRSALDIREKLLTRQIDAIHHQNRHRKTKLIDQMKFLPDNQENVLAHIRLLGRFNLDNFPTSEPFIVEDYICPNDDHDFMYKGFNGNVESNVSTVLDFSNNKALINENANNINDSIINITLNESRELIEESKELIERAKLFELDEFLAEPEKKIPIEVEPVVASGKRNSQKIKIHNCSGTINLKNISKLTINANCRGTDKKDNLSFTTSETSSSTPMVNDANCATYNCEFYNRLINEIKNCIRRSDHSDMSSTTKENSSFRNSSSSAFTPDSNSFDSHSKKILLKNIKNLKIQIPNGKLNGYVDANTITHPVQIEEWLKQIISETEIEPMQNVEILEHSIINTPSTPTSP
ncbi:hypothetical protein Bhyg_07008 [Pseudolycoriella hygida]|uniref:Uncharacterized protein n=1 Tax=Pseudolycoriella hygida TaxID=35572 RepID=A0A9Q0N2X5_9DIPT|nr:hypothetical protein Bhyg_07008 [Pseudolycoriella hygida]